VCSISRVGTCHKANPRDDKQPRRWWGLMDSRLGTFFPTRPEPCRAESSS
jgi:hypothetical protein